jgi:hypothetical protein
VRQGEEPAAFCWPRLPVECAIASPSEGVPGEFERGSSVGWEGPPGGKVGMVGGGFKDFGPGLFMDIHTVVAPLFELFVICADVMHFLTSWADIIALIGVGESVSPIMIWHGNSRTTFTGQEHIRPDYTSSHLLFPHQTSDLSIIFIPTSYIHRIGQELFQGPSLHIQLT